MKILIGKDVKEINCDTLKSLLVEYDSVVVDIGTGSGDFVYRKAKENPRCFYIGIDSSKESMLENAVKITKKLSKGGLSNVLYVLANAEDLPLELANIADKIYVNLPWGSLRDGLVKAEEKVLNSIRMLGKNKTLVDVSITYSKEHEVQEMMSRNLPSLSYQYFIDILKPKYTAYGLYIKKINVWDNLALRNLNTKWANKLAYGKKRDFYNYSFAISK